MSRIVPSAPSRRAARLRRLSAVCVGCALGLPAVATAAPVTITVPGHDDASPVAPEDRIKTLATTIDPATGAWSTTVAFSAPQQASPGLGLRVSLQLVGSRASAASWYLRTAPGPSSLQYENPVPAVVYPAPPTTATFNAERTALTVQVTDPQLVGRVADKLSATLHDPDVNGGGASVAEAFFGPRAPHARVPAAAKRLVVGAGGRLRIPLSPLPARAQRTVMVNLPHHHALTGAVIPSDGYRRRSVSVRLSADQLRHLSRAPRSVTLVIRTMLPNGDKANTSAAVSIRRR